MARRGGKEMTAADVTAIRDAQGTDRVVYPSGLTKVHVAPLSLLRFMTKSRVAIGRGGGTVGSQTLRVIHSVVGKEEWDAFKQLTTTVGLELPDAEDGKIRIHDRSGWEANVRLNDGDRQALVANLRACRQITARHSVVLAGVTSSSAPRPPHAKRRPQGAHAAPETPVENEDNEYRELMERLIRSSLPEIMDRDFQAPARSALRARNRKRGLQNMKAVPTF